MKRFLGENTAAGIVQTMMTIATRKERKTIFSICKKMADRTREPYELQFLCELKKITDLGERFQKGDSANDRGSFHASTPTVARRGGKVPADANPAGNAEQPAPFEPKRKKRILNRVELIDS